MGKAVGRAVGCGSSSQGQTSLAGLASGVGMLCCTVGGASAPRLDEEMLVVSAAVWLDLLEARVCLRWFSETGGNLLANEEPELDVGRLSARVKLDSVLLLNGKHETESRWRSLMNESVNDERDAERSG